jgi:hypothetical protein
VIVYTAANATVVIKLIQANAKHVIPFEFNDRVPLSSVCQIALSLPSSPFVVGFKTNIVIDIAKNNNTVIASKILETLIVFFNWQLNIKATVENIIAIITKHNVVIPIAFNLKALNPVSSLTVDVQKPKVILGFNKLMLKFVERPVAIIIERAIIIEIIAT